jgi:hypothetical protein
MSHRHLEQIKQQRRQSVNKRVYADLPIAEPDDRDFYIHAKKNLHDLKQLQINTSASTETPISQTNQTTPVSNNPKQIETLKAKKSIAIKKLSAMSSPRVLSP